MMAIQHCPEDTTRRQLSLSSKNDFLVRLKITGCNLLGIIFLLYLAVQCGRNLQSLAQMLKCQLQSLMPELITQSNLRSSNIEENKNKYDSSICRATRPIPQTQLKHHATEGPRKISSYWDCTIIVSCVVRT